MMVFLSGSVHIIVWLQILQSIQSTFSTNNLSANTLKGYFNNNAS